ncbi:enoyl-CoA hydratase/isomerase family protein [Streptomyces coeruleorubidus]|uniref:enoyl-CoA hydratase/isomerase family protein n=1 Tax=Streptomyces coeruleorubidus TaxID=116188 RepID=UPI0037B0B835
MSDRTPGAAAPVEDDGSVRALTLHQPGRHNALDPTGRQELLTALRDASRDERCRAVVPTGAGGSFCAGGDIRSMTPVPEESAARTEVVTGIVRAVVRGPEPVLVAV